MTHRDLIGDGNLRSWTLLWQWSFKVSMLCFCRPSQAVVSTIVPGEWLNRVATVPPSTLLLRFGRHFRDTKAWILKRFPRLARFFHFPWTPSKLVVLSIDSWTDVAFDFEVTSSWLYPWWSGPPKLQPWSSARTATTGEKTRTCVGRYAAGQSCNLVSLWSWIYKHQTQINPKLIIYPAAVHDFGGSHFRTNKKWHFWKHSHGLNFFRTSSQHGMNKKSSDIPRKNIGLV